MLSTRYPFPVRKGDQVVLNNRLSILQKKYHIDLVTFINNSKYHFDDEKKFKNVTFHKIKFSYLEALKNILINFFQYKPFQIVIYNQSAIKNYIEKLISENNYSKIHYILIRSSYFVSNKEIPNILDAVDSMHLNLKELVQFCNSSKKINNLVCKKEDIWLYKTIEKYGKVEKNKDRSWKNLFLKLVYYLDRYTDDKALTELSKEGINPNLVLPITKCLVIGISSPCWNSLIISDRIPL